LSKLDEMHQAQLLTKHKPRRHAPSALAYAGFGITAVGVPVLLGRMVPSLSLWILVSAGIVMGFAVAYLLHGGASRFAQHDRAQDEQ
jgi:uncharacterized RDD family membrane protein YckC